MAAKCPIKTAAREAGETLYYTGKPCVHGHICKRYVRCGGCVECSKAASMAYSRSPSGVAYRKRWRSQPHIRKKEREYSHRYSKRYHYGLEWEDFERMLNEAGHKCQICKQSLIANHSRSEGKKSNAACVDHCHETKSVRGILCNRCNRAIGLLGDDPQILDRAAAYLRR